MANHAAPVPDWLTKEYLEENFQKALQVNKLKLEKCEITPASKAGDNYAGQLFRILLTYQHRNKYNEFPVIAKLKANTETMKGFETQHNMHNTEVKYLASVMNEIQKLGYICGPKIYFSDLKNDTIFMEDLKVRGFEMARSKYLDLSHCLLTVEALAITHAVSVKLLEKDETLKDRFSSTIWKKEANEAIRGFTRNAMKSLIHAAEKDIVNFREDQIKYLKEVSVKLEEDYFYMYEKTCDSFNVILHGDLWKNNMMFRYKGSNVEEVCLVDYQVASYNPFWDDLQYFIFSSAEENVILNNIEDLLHHYYDTLIKVNPNLSRMTFETIKSQFESNYSYGLLISFLVRHLPVIEKPVDVEDMCRDTGKDVSDMGHSGAIYLNSIVKILPFFEKRGIIQSYLEH